MKKVISFVLTTVLLLTLLVSAAFAAGTTVAASAEEGAHGDTVTVDVTISGNTGFDTYLISLDYDSTALELVGMTAGALSANGNFVSNGNAAAFMTTSVVTGDGILFKANFKILEGAPAGANAVNVVVDNVTNTVTFEDLGASAAPGKVTVEAAPCEHANTSLVGAKDATCSAEGYTGDTVCDDCGETVKKGEVIKKLDHTEKLEGAKEATCSEEGYTGDTVCSVCGETIKKGEVVAKKDHDWNWVVDKEATATETGLKHEECSVCGEKRNEDTVIPATGAGLDDVPSTGDLTLTILPIVLVMLAVIGTCVLVTKRKAVK